jgi:hypothetical protein
MDIVGTLLLASGAIVAYGAIVTFSRVRLEADSVRLVDFMQLWRHKGHTPAGRRLLAWLNLAVSLQLLGVAALTLWFLLEG